MKTDSLTPISYVFQVPSAGRSDSRLEIREQSESKIKRFPRWAVCRASGLLLALMMLATGCAEYGHLEFGKVPLSPAPVSFSENAVLLTEGTAVAVRVRAYWSDGDRIGPDEGTIRLVAEDPMIFDLELLAGHDDDYIFYGLMVGESDLIVRLDGDVVDRIPVVVEGYPVNASGW